MPRIQDNGENRTYSHNPRIQKFYEDHGAHTMVGTFIIFEDGAKLEHDGLKYGVMLEPPTDDFERAKAIYQFWEIKAGQAKNAFQNFKAMCEGHGIGWWPAHVLTDDDKIQHLEKLRNAARKARNKLREAQEELDDATPEWLLEKYREQAAEAQRREKLRNRAKDVRL